MKSYTLSWDEAVVIEPKLKIFQGKDLTSDRISDILTLLNSALVCGVVSGIMPTLTGTIFIILRP